MLSSDFERILIHGNEVIQSTIPQLGTGIPYISIPDLKLLLSLILQISYMHNKFVKQKGGVGGNRINSQKKPFAELWL